MQVTQRCARHRMTCWRFRSRGAMRVWPQDTLLENQPVLQRLRPRFEGDRDLRLKWTSACYDVSKAPENFAPVAAPEHSVLEFLDRLADEGFVLCPKDRLALAVALPFRVLWFVDAENAPLQPNMVPCQLCGAPCQLKRVRFWPSPGVSQRLLLCGRPRGSVLPETMWMPVPEQPGA